MSIGRRLFWGLFFSNLVCWSTGNGLLPLLPVHARDLGASARSAGLYMGAIYASLTVGLLAGGWLCDRIRRLRLAIAVLSACFSAGLWWIGQASDLTDLTVSTAYTWLMGGMQLSALTVVAALGASREERGGLFGWLATTTALGTVLGGLTIGFAADHYGYPRTFWLLALFNLVNIPLAAMLDDRREVAAPGHATPIAAGSPHAWWLLWLLLLVVLLEGVGRFVGRLSLTLMMDDARYSSGAIATTSAIGGALVLPLPWWLGKLSDRRPRRQILVICLVIGLLGLATLALATGYWHFLAASAGISVMACVIWGTGSALTTDVTPPERLGRALSLLNAASLGSGIIGFVAAGYLYQQLGPTGAVAIAGGMLLAALLALVPLRVERAPS